MGLVRVPLFIANGPKCVPITVTKSTERNRRFCEFKDCQATFGQQGDLRRHVKIVHFKEKPFKCMWPNCEMSSGHKRDLTKHIHF